jgi:hypothetical protein
MEVNVITNSVFAFADPITRMAPAFSYDQIKRLRWQN